MIRGLGVKSAWKVLWSGVWDDIVTEDTQCVLTIQARMFPKQCVDNTLVFQRLVMLDIISY